MSREVYPCGHQATSSSTCTKCELNQDQCKPSAKKPIKQYLFMDSSVPDAKDVVDALSIQSRAINDLNERLVSAESTIKMQGELIINLEKANKNLSDMLRCEIEIRRGYCSPTQEATKPECSHPIIRISPSSLSGKLNNLTCVDCGEDLTCVDCGKDFMPNVVPTTEPRKLANKLHNARHVASGMTESKAEVNWNQHTEASQQHVWGHVAEVAVKEVERVIDGWNLFYDKCMAENLKTELRRKLL